MNFCYLDPLFVRKPWLLRNKRVAFADFYVTKEWLFGNKTVAFHFPNPTVLLHRYGSDSYRQFVGCLLYLFFFYSPCVSCIYHLFVTKRVIWCLLEYVFGLQNQ